MGNIIKVKLDDKEYKLEFNRRTILKMEAEGLTGDKGEQLQKDHPLDFAYKFVRYAFVKNHSDLTDEEFEDIMDRIEDLPAFIEAVADILKTSIQTIQEGGDGKNAKWERA